MRRVVPLLLAGVLVSGVSGSALAASLSFTGSIDAEITYTPEDKWMGRTGIEISSGMSATNKYTLKLGYFDEEKNFWQGYSTWTFRPSEISLYAQGALWSGGPTLKGTLGDFAMLGPVYIAGDTEKAALRGIMVENLPFGATRTSVYWGWPREDIAPLTAEPQSKSWGGSVGIANYRGLSLTAYGAIRTGQFESSWGDSTRRAPDGTVMVFDHVDETNVSPYEGLYLYTENYHRSSGWYSSLNWDMAFITSDGRIIKYIPAGTSKDGWGPPDTNPAYEYVITAYKDPALQWIRDHIKPYAETEQRVMWESSYIDVHNYAEAVGALEGTYAIAGLRLKGQLGRLVTTEHITPKQPGLPTQKESSKTFASFYIVSASTDVPIGTELAAKPLTLTGEYRNIDEGFTPWARSTVTDTSESGYNRIEAQRGQRGFNLVASSTIVPENPVDIKLTLDSYTRGEEKSQTATLELTTKLAGYELASKLGTDSTELAVAREINLGIKDITKFKPSYTVTLGADSSSSYKLALDMVVSLGAFRGIAANFGYETKLQAGQQNATTITSASATYKAPNGWELSGGWVSPDDTSTRDDTYLRLYYKVNI